MTDPNEIRDLLHPTRIDMDLVADRLEKLRPADRVTAVRSIGGAEQARLWEAALGRRVTIGELVPRDVGPLVPVRFYGRNSLPLFSLFEKRFCRPSADVDRDELWGFNYQPTRWLAPLTGPGYFVAYDSDDPQGGVAIDYCRIPPARPADWPTIRSNDFRLSRFIYRGMVDYLRRISAHVLIGRATRDGRPLPNYFLLCREEPPRGE